MRTVLVAAAAALGALTLGAAVVATTMGLWFGMALTGCFS